MSTSVRSFSYVASMIAALSLFVDLGANAETSQEHIHRMSHDIMPFDVSKTVHIFKMTESGGVERVVATDAGDAEQIALIKQHLKQEAERFQRGDYSDPAKLHGADMPGLQELRAHASLIKVSYSELPAGSQIIFETRDVRMLTAIHRWFGAQLSEHGADAKAE